MLGETWLGPSMNLLQLAQRDSVRGRDLAELLIICSGVFGCPKAWETTTLAGDVCDFYSTYREPKEKVAQRSEGSLTAGDLPAFLWLEGNMSGYIIFYNFIIFSSEKLCHQRTRWSVGFS